MAAELRLVGERGTRAREETRAEFILQVGERYFERRCLLLGEDVGVVFLVLRHFYMYAFCSCSAKANERQGMKDKTERNRLLHPPKPSDSESPGVAEGPGWHTTD